MAEDRALGGEDLTLSRALVDMFSRPAVAVLFDPPGRYSETSISLWIDHRRVYSDLPRHLGECDRAPEDVFELHAARLELNQVADVATGANAPST